MESYLGLIGAVTGGLLVWVLTELTRCVTHRKRAARDLRVACFSCRDRLLKIKNADAHNNTKTRDNEIDLLGMDMDKYRNQIAAYPHIHMREKHMEIYERLIPILLQHDLSSLDDIIEDLKKLT